MAKALTQFVVCMGLLFFSVSASGQLLTLATSCTQSQTSCGSYCGQAPRFGPCHCDRLCLLYQDCCEGFNTSCPDVHQEALHLRSKYPDVRPLCQPDGSGKVLEGCGPLEGKEALAANCSRGSKLEDPALFPVWLSDLGASFVNRYCALCNDVSSIDLQVWNTGIPRDITDTGDLSSPETVEEILANVLNQASPLSAASKLVWRHPQGQTRPCLPKAVSQCPDLGTGGELAAACSGYASYVTGELGRVFLNRHCALCHGERLCLGVSWRDFLSSEYHAGDVSYILQWRSLGSVVLSTSVTNNGWSTMSCSVTPSPQCSIETCHSSLRLFNGVCQKRLALSLSFCSKRDATTPGNLTQPTSPAPKVHESTSVMPSTLSTADWGLPSNTVRPPRSSLNGGAILSGKNIGFDDDTRVPTPSSPEKSHDIIMSRRQAYPTFSKGCRDDVPLEVMNLAEFLLHETGRFLAALSPDSHYDSAVASFSRDSAGNWLLKSELWWNVEEAHRLDEGLFIMLKHFYTLLRACVYEGTRMGELDDICVNASFSNTKDPFVGCYNPAFMKALSAQPSKSRDMEAKCRVPLASVDVCPGSSGRSDASDSSSGSDTSGTSSGSALPDLSSRRDDSDPSSGSDDSDPSSGSDDSDTSSGSDDFDTSSGSDVAWPGLWWRPLLVCWHVLQSLRGPLSLQA